MNLDNKVVLITGSTRGIGNSIARLFLENSAKVVICGSNIENAKKAVESIKSDLKFFAEECPWAFFQNGKEKIWAEFIVLWGKVPRERIRFIRK